MNQMCYEDELMVEVVQVDLGRCVTDFNSTYTVLLKIRSVIEALKRFEAPWRSRAL